MKNKWNHLRGVIIICILTSIFIFFQANSSFAAETDKTLKTPTIRAVEDADDYYIQIKWSKVSSADGYQIYRSTRKNGNFKKIATVKSTKRIYTDKKVKLGVRYYYKVRAYQKTGGKIKYSKFSGKKSRKVPEKVEYTSVRKPADEYDKLYSFGALSDVHIGYETSDTDLQKALSYLNKQMKVDFTCICGDLTADGRTHEFSRYKTIVEQNSADTPVYAITGNHDSHVMPMTDAIISAYTGQPMYYSFEHNGDVFIMCGQWQEWNEYLFSDGALQWLYETLEANRNKRCFVFFHIFPWGDSGNPGNWYPSDLFTGTQGAVFQSLMQHYKNVVLFHGHSHFKFDLQRFDSKANYSDALGYRSIHIPSVTAPRTVINEMPVYLYNESEGYVVDVYKNAIHLRGVDFVKDEFVDTASYWIDTTLVEIEPKAYKDSSATITT